ncbi:MAG: butyrate kinase [Oscillospiraceae bacterium]|nr:butyrate kinase [Oscillospiraceae bacterium]
MKDVFRIFVLNPGSTSTKVALFENDTCVYKTCVYHDANKLLTYPTLNDQLNYRLEVIDQYLQENGIDLTGIDAFAARGGSPYSMESGAYAINWQIVKDTYDMRGGLDHASNLGVQLAWELNKKYGGIMITADPICVDEYTDVARMTGVKGVYRKSHLHTLNMKGTARLHAKLHGEKYEERNYIVCHIDGGVTIAAHCHGKMIDGNDGIAGEGPYTPSRTGGIPVNEYTEYLEQQDNLDFAEVKKLCVRTGGFISHLGTSNSDQVHAMIEAGDKYAELVWNGMIYNIIKMIGAMAAVLSGKVDAIILTGGLMRFPEIIQQIEAQCGWIAPISVYPDEVENEVLADYALQVLRGEIEAKTYPGHPVWQGFDFEH